MSLSDIFYPDNSKREKRAGELVADISVSVSGLEQNKTAIEGALKEANEIIKQAFSKYTDPIPKEINVDLGESWIVPVIEVLTSAVTYKAASSGLYNVIGSYLVRTGGMTEAAFAARASLPKWFKAGKVGGALVAVAAITAILDSIFGAVRRKKLRGIIKELIPSRIKFKKSELISDEILIPLRTLIATVKVLEGRIPREELIIIINDTIAKEHAKLDLITDSFTKIKLRQLDHNRGSWTKED